MFVRCVLQAWESTVIKKNLNPIWPAVDIPVQVSVATTVLCSHLRHFVMPTLRAYTAATRCSVLLMTFHAYATANNLVPLP